MREIEFRGKRVDNGEWAYGFYFEIEHNDDKTHVHGYITANPLLEKMPESAASFIEVETKTAGQFTGLCDKNGEGIYEGDIVKFNSRVGEVVFTCGCFGIGFRKCIDYDSMLKEIHEYTSCDNRLYACENDNFISLWEIFWNYNEEDQRLEAVEVIGNIHENPELMEATA